MNNETVSLHPLLSDLVNLEGLAADRGESTCEIFTPNDFYGHASILKRYAGMDPQAPLAGVLPHGIGLNSNNLWEKELECPLPYIYSVSDEKSEVYRQRCSKEVLSIGSVLHYAKRLFHDQVKMLQESARGTVVFPHHSTHHVTVGFDQEYLIKALQKLPSHMGPIRVCCYWRDIQLEAHQKYLEAGYECLTAGHMYDLGFFERLIRILASHDHVVTNEIGTPSMYAATMGLKVHLIKQRLLETGRPEFLLDNSGPNLPSALSLMESMCSTPGEAKGNQQKWGDIGTGRSAVLEPDVLKAMLTTHIQSVFGRKTVASPVSSWEQEIASLRSAIQSDEKTGCASGTMQPEGKVFKFSSARRVIDDHDTMEMPGIFPRQLPSQRPVLMDCGCDVGLTSMLLSRRFPNAIIHGFEADPDKARMARENLDAFGNDQVSFYHKAVWIKQGSVVFERELRDGATDQLQVPSIRLGDFLAETPVDLMRLNVGQATYKLIEDCGNDLRNVRHLVIRYPSLGKDRNEFVLLLTELSALGFSLQVKNVVVADREAMNMDILIVASL
jgi:FkbM family methyltransferase